jgi:vanillate O-demethylase monooxygenase subunit
MSLLPDHEALGLTSTDFQVDGDSYHEVPGRYMLMHDNLLDLTHLPYLHQSSIASGDFDNGKEVHEHGENWLSSSYSFEDIDCPPFYADVFGYHGKIDRESGLRLYLPCLHAGYDRYRRASTASERPGEELGELSIFHAVTPATRYTAHYFFALGRNFRRDDAAFGRAMMDGIEKVIDEDMRATREIENILGGLDEVPSELLLKSDKQCVLGRRLFEGLIRKESAANRPDVPAVPKRNS